MNQETTIITENSIIEIGEAIILTLCLLRCLQYSVQSRVLQGRYFWLASVLVFFSVIRRELSYLSDLLVPEDFMLIGHSYDWWEDRILLVIIVAMLILLVRARHYFWTVLKNIPKSLYLGVAVLAVLQYMGENAIMFPHEFGEVVEETSENIIYMIALIYLWQFKLSIFENLPSSQKKFTVLNQQ